MKMKKLETSLIFLTLILFPALLFASEEITFTTYYPSPYGSYNDLQANRMAVGDVNGDGNLDENDLPANIDELAVASRIGIGTRTPLARLYLHQEANKGINIRLFNYVALGGTRSAWGTVLGNNVKADDANNAQNRMVNITGHDSYAGSAIYLQGNDGITFHTRPAGRVGAGATYYSPRMKITAEGNVGVGTTAPTSTLQNSGSFAVRSRTINANVTLNATDHIIFCNAQNGRVTVDLPIANNIVGRQYIITKIDASANICRVRTQRGETMNGYSDSALSSPGDTANLVSAGGSSWLHIGVLPNPSMMLTFGGSNYTRFECADAGGSVIDTGQTGTLCKFMGNDVSCPRNWTQAANYQRYRVVGWGDCEDGDQCRRYQDSGPLTFADTPAVDNEYAGYIERKQTTCDNEMDWGTWHGSIRYQGQMDETHDLYRVVMRGESPVQNRIEIGCK